MDEKEKRYEEWEAEMRAKEQAKLAESKRLGVKVGIWVHLPGRKTSRATHMAMNGKPFLLSEGLYDSAVGRKVLPSQEPGCHCTYRDFVPEFGDVATPEIEKLLQEAERAEHANAPRERGSWATVISAFWSALRRRERGKP